MHIKTVTVTDTYPANEINGYEHYAMVVCRSLDVAWSTVYGSSYPDLLVKSRSSGQMIDVIC